MSLRMAMIGLGVISKYYARGFDDVDEVELVAVCDTLEDKLAPYRARGIATASTLEEILERDDVDAIAINLPNDAHREACETALRHGLHVCCEKPLATTVADARAMVATAREHERLLFTSFHRRYNANYVALAADVDPRRIVRATARYHEDIREHAGDDSWYLDPARCGGGCVADNGPNALELLHGLVGAMSVRGVEIERDGNGVDTFAALDLESGDGVPCRVELDWAYSNGELKDVTVELDDGSVRRADMLAGWNGFKESLYHEYAGVLRAFAAAVEESDERGEVGLAMVALIEDAYALAAEPAR